MGSRSGRRPQVSWIDKVCVKRFRKRFDAAIVTQVGIRPTINDVAAAAGVSVATVSKAVNGRYGVAQETVDRVLRVVHELGYESSIIASSMRSRKTGVIGVLVAEFEPFSAEVLKGVGAALNDSGYDLLAYSGSAHNDSEGWERRSLSRLGGTLIDGAILVTPSVVDITSEIPLVAVDPHTGPAELPTVESDSFGGAYRATRHLIELGHERIGFIAGRPDLRSSIARDAGYRKALKSAGLHVDDELVGAGRYRKEDIRGAATAMLQLPDPPTAIFAANDISAIEIVRIAAELGVVVPTDLSVIGFDDIPEAAQVTPALTTVHQPIQGLGALAAQTLIRIMQTGRIQRDHLRLPTRLISRATTAPPLGRPTSA